MASDLVTPSVEHHCIIKFLVKEKVKSANILYMLNAQYGKGPCHFQVSVIGTVSFLKAVKKLNTQLSASKFMPLVLWDSE
jgi:hypothetical protein